MSAGQGPPSVSPLGSGPPGTANFVECGEVPPPSAMFLWPFLFVPTAPLPLDSQGSALPAKAGLHFCGTDWDRLSLWRQEPLSLMSRDVHSRGWGSDGG